LAFGSWGCTHTCPHTRKPNCPCDWLHLQIGALQSVLVTSHSDFVIWKDNDTIINYLRLSGAVFSLMLKNCFHVYRLTYGRSLFEWPCFNNANFAAPYNPFLYFLISSESVYEQIFLAISSVAEEIPMTPSNESTGLYHAVTSLFAHHTAELEG